MLSGQGLGNKGLSHVKEEFMEVPDDWEALTPMQRLDLLERVRSVFDKLSNRETWLQALEQRVLTSVNALPLAEAKLVLRVLEHLESVRPELESKLLLQLDDPRALLGQKLGVLGACGGDQSLRALEELRSSESWTECTSFVQKQWHKAMGRLRRRLAPPSVLELDKLPWNRKVRWVLQCVPGMEVMLVSEIREKLASELIVESCEAMSGEVWVQPVRHAFALHSLMKLRLFSEARMVLVPHLAGLPKAMEPMLEEVVTALSDSALASIPKVCTQGPIRFALRTSGKQRPSGAQLAKAARKLEKCLNAVSHGDRRWINDPRDEDWVFQLHWTAADQLRLGLQIAAEHWDLRFAYRIADLPAASHPVVAALLAREALPLLAQRAEVLDPFCGSALELIELGRARPDLRLRAGDVSAEALRIAAMLAERAQVTLESLECKDVLQWSRQQDLDAVVTNPPFGRRAKSADIVELLQLFLKAIPGWLKHGGVLVWISPQPRRTAATLTEVGMHLLTRQAMDLGGIRVELQVAQKR